MHSITVVFELFDYTKIEDFDGRYKSDRYFKDDIREYCRKPRTYTYSRFTTIRAFLNRICEESGFSKVDSFGLFSIEDYFEIMAFDQRRGFGNIDIPVLRLLNYLRQEDGAIYLIWTYWPYAGGADVHYQDGIKFIIHTDEYVHRGRPHVHAQYSGDVIKIDIQTLKTKGKLKNKKKQKEAIRIVNENKAFFIQKWREYTGGLNVPDYYYNAIDGILEQELIG